MNTPIPDLLIPQAQNNPVSAIMQFMDKGVNPYAMAQQMLQNNPQVRQFMQQVQTQSMGRSPKGMALQYAKQNGISENEIMQLASRFGLH